MNEDKIVLKKVRVHNLKAVDISLEKNTLIVFTGVSGSGKSSLAFDTIYAEGQRRYVESLSNYARRQIGELSKPELEFAGGISPTISIEQKTAGRNPRSTVGTMTEIYDYLRVLYARVGIPYCPVSGEQVRPQSRERIIKSIQSMTEETKIIILSPYARNKKAEFRENFQELIRKGYMRVRVDGSIVNLTEELTLDGNLSHDIDVVIDRLSIGAKEHSRIADSITQALEMGEGLCSVLNSETHEEELFSMHAYSPKSGLSYSSLEPYDFSFNSPSGMCPRCHGVGTIYEFNLDLVINPELSISEDCCSVASSYQTVKYGNIYDHLADAYNFSVKTPWKKLSPPAKKVFLYGTEKKWTRIHFVHPITGARWVDNIRWQGVLHDAHTRFAEAKSENYRKKMQMLMSIQTCPECNGERLKPYPAATLLQGMRISALTSLTIADCLLFFQNLTLSRQEQLIAEELVKEIARRLHFLMEVGLHYLTLDRTAPTLSGGEAQRVRLASQIGGGLVGITYILDEPSIGLHPRDNQKLIETLKHLRSTGNTVIVVEHDEETIWEADSVVDFGPGAGSQGGEILTNGDIRSLLNHSKSLTGAYLSGRMEIPIPASRRMPSKSQLQIMGASHHNLQNLSVAIPLGVFVAITGVSGSGKSSLISDILYPALSNELHGGEHVVGAHQKILGIENLDKVIAIDQSPIGRNPRSNPATYIKIFDEIRDLYSKLPESQARGYKSGRFSFNVKEGSCSQCAGMGQIKVDMDFMEDAWVDCPLCKTKRFDSETLSVLFKEKSIYDVLEMSVSEALDFFSSIPSMHHKLETLSQVGMDYIKLGQASTTLSGGEAQRIKLAKELVRPATGKTLYILDEPTTGLHFHDIMHLLQVLHALVDKGNSVIVIEHNMEVVKTADWIIDLGPEGGKGGGRLVASGNPEEISEMKTPTGEAVKHALHPKRREKMNRLLKSPSKKPLKKSKRDSEQVTSIVVTDAEQNNLKGISVTIPRDQMTICTGPSGSGKSSLAFETIYAEGQRRYIESLSPYARQFVKQMPKPKVGHVSGLSPAIAIEQKAHAGNPRSTVGTMTEIYDFLRVLFARLGIPHCPETGEVIQAISKEHVVEKILSYPNDTRLHILAPIEIGRQERFEDLMGRFRRQGFMRIRLNGELYQIDEESLSHIPFDRKRKNELYLVIDRLKVDPSIKTRLYEAVEHAASFGENRLAVLRDDLLIPYNLSFAVESTGKSYSEITPHTFAFNTEEGMCPECQGLGTQYGANLMHNSEILRYSTYQLMQTLWLQNHHSAVYSFLEQFLNLAGIDPHTPLRLIPQDKIQLFMQGMNEEQWLPAKDGLRTRWLGINHVLAKAGSHAKAHIKEAVIPLLNEQVCLSCQGARINALARHVTLEGKTIQEICGLSLENALKFIQNIHLNIEERKLLEEVHLQLIRRLQFLCEIGLHYISLNRRSPTLSGGEAQRIHLARQLGSGLTGVLYVLDEPTIGLHPHDNARLNEALQKLKELGNTLLVVEHDPLTIAASDYILDFGPQSGEHGGHITAKGTLKQILRNPRSLTGAYLSGKKKISLPEKRRAVKKGGISIKNAAKNNLKNLTFDIPIGVMTCLSGVSGSGKSTLLEQILLPAAERRLISDPVLIEGATISGLSNFDKIIFIDQNPIGNTIRSDVGTYTDVLTRLRDFFASLPAARLKGLQPKHFSYNHRRGMCTSCWGMGYRRVEMHFLPPVKVECEMCKGMKLNPVSLNILYKEKNLGQYLKMTVNEARIVFENHPRVTRILDTLISVGLGYIKLGQETASLSGGEAQRLKLSRELAKRSTGSTLYLLDEPTSGLHQDDIQKLLIVLQRLVDKGNTMVIIEHQLDIIKSADYVIDLGPEAGEKGGRIVCKGTPEEVAKNKHSLTGRYLKEVL